MIEVKPARGITATEVFLDQLKSAGMSGGADIVNISSVAGRTARAGNGVYAATNWGLNGWSEALRQELLPDVCAGHADRTGRSGHRTARAHHPRRHQTRRELLLRPAGQR